MGGDGLHGSRWQGSWPRWCPHEHPGSGLWHHQTFSATGITDVEQSGYIGEVYANVTKVERKKIDAMDGPRDVVVLTVSTQIIVETEGTAG
jgi:hypothetical protein